MSSTKHSSRTDNGLSNSKPIILQLPPLYAYQTELVRSSATEKVVVSATQVGKTTACACWLLARAWENPGRLFWWAAPIHRQTKIGYAQLCALAKSANVLWWKLKAPELRMGLINGSVIDFQSWERDANLQGPTVSATVIDEAGLLTPSARAIISSRRSATLGPIAYIGNPTHNRSEFFRLCKQAQDDTTGRFWYKHWTWRDKMKALPTKQALEYQSFITNESTDQLNSEFERLYEASFTDVTERVLDITPICVNGGDVTTPVKLPFSEDVPDEPCVMGLDLAQITDYMVACVVGIKTGRMYAMDRYRRMPWNVQVDRAARLARKYHSTVFVDATGLGGPVVEMLSAAFRKQSDNGMDKPVGMMPITFTGERKMAIYQSLQLAVQQERMSMPFIKEAVSECDTLEYKPRAGFMGYEAQSGFNDDIPTAMALAAYGKSRVITGSIQ